jgi:hypothetical protein
MEYVSTMNGAYPSITAVTWKIIPQILARNP